MLPFAALPAQVQRVYLTPPIFQLPAKTPSEVRKLLERRCECKPENLITSQGAECVDKGFDKAQPERLNKSAIP